jgi:hypothetical protein
LRQRRARPSAKPPKSTEIVALKERRRSCDFGLRGASVKGFSAVLCAGVNGCASAAISRPWDYLPLDPNAEIVIREPLPPQQAEPADEAPAE